MFEYDRTKNGYHSPPELFARIEKLYARPLDRAMAIHLVLESVDGDIRKTRQNFLVQTSSVLQVSINDIERLGLEEARRAWIDTATQEIMDELNPAIVVPSMLEAFGSRLDEDPSDDLLAEIDQRKTDLPIKLVEQEKYWSFSQIASAIESLAARSNPSLERIDTIGAIRKTLDQMEIYKGYFETVSRKVQELEFFENTDESRQNLQQHSQTKNLEPYKNRIPLACDESLLLSIADRLVEAELLYSNVLENEDQNFLVHFSLNGAAFEAQMPNEPQKINWRSTIYDLLQLFSWFSNNELMSEREARRAPSLISKHFLHEGSEITRGTVSGMKSSGPNNERPLNAAEKKIKQALKSIMLNNA